jgi:hypothetical protein
MSRILGLEELYYPFTLSFAAQLAIIGVASLKYDYPEMKAWTALLLGTGIGWLLVFGPVIIMVPLGVLPGHWLAMVFAIPLVGVAAVVFYGIQPSITDCPTDTARWVRQGLCGSMASVFGLLPLYMT